MLKFPKPDAEQFFRTYTISGFDVSEDEKRLVFSSNLSGKVNLWAMEMEKGFPYPLTYIDQGTDFIKIDPRNRYILAGFDNDGDENYKIYAIPPEGGQPLPILTGAEHEKYYFGDLSRDGERIYYMTSRDNPSFLDIRLCNLKTGEDKLILKGEGQPTYLAAVSKRETSFAYIRLYANTYATGFMRIDREDVCLTPDPGVIHTVTDVVFEDEARVFFVTNYESDFSYVAQFDANGREFSPVLTLDREEVKVLKRHKQSGALYMATTKGVQDYLYRFDPSTRELTPVPCPVHSIEQLLVADSGNLYVLGRTATSNFNIYQRDSDENWRALTDNRVLGVPEEEMVNPEVVSYTSFDGLTIEALLFRAKAGVANGYTVFWPHGGPQWAERKSFRALFQFLLGRGYTIFAPNFRGSTGYGAEFAKMVEGDWGEGPRLDCVAGIEWLFEQGISKRDRLFVVGGSFGGYMTLLLAGRHPEYFRAAVDIFGPSNLFTFVESVPDHWKPMMKKWLGDPEEDRERFIKDSPLTYLDAMTKPMLVIQGANDPRVVKAESDQIVASLRSRGVEVEYLVLEDEGHGFSKKENEIKAYRLIADFLDRHR